jgi:WD40 repeat protein
MTSGQTWAAVRGVWRAGATAALVVCAWLVLTKVMPPPRPKPVVAESDLAMGPLAGPDTDPLPAGAVVRLGRERLRQGRGAVELAFSPDHRMLASVEWLEDSRGGSAAIHLWDVATGREIRRLETTIPGFLFNLRFSADGKQVSAVGSIGLCSWEADTGKEVRLLKGPWSSSFFQVVSRNGKLLAWTTHSPDAIHVLDVATGQEVSHFAAQKGEFPVDFVLSNRLLITSVSRDTPEGMVRCREVVSGREKMRLSGCRYTCIGFHVATHGDFLTAWDLLGPIRSWDIKTGRELRRVSVFPPAAHGACVAASPEGQTVAVGGGGGLIRWWDTGTGELIHEVHAHGGSVRSMAISGDGKLLASGISSEGAIQLWDVVTGQQLAPCEGHQAAITSLSIAPDGRSVATAGEDETIRVWEPSTGRELRRYPTGSNPSVVMSPDGRLMAAGSGRAGNASLKLLDTATGRTVRACLEADASPLGNLAYSADGTLLTAGGHGRRLVWWEVATGLPAGESASSNWAFWASAFSPEGKVLAMSLARRIELRKLHGLELVRGFSAADQPPGSWCGFACLTFSPDGQSLAAADGFWSGSHDLPGPPPDAAIRIYEVATGRERLVLKGHRWLVHAVQFSPDGRTLASGGDDGLVHLWDLPTGREWHRFAGHRGAVTCLAFSPDGRTVISGSKDTTALVWDVTQFQQR